MALEAVTQEKQSLEAGLLHCRDEYKSLFLAKENELSMIKDEFSALLITHENVLHGLETALEQEKRDKEVIDNLKPIQRRSENTAQILLQKLTQMVQKEEVNRNIFLMTIYNSS